MRGLRTLHVRVREAAASAAALAQRFAEHPKVSHVLYPGLPSHPYYDLARQTMRGFGGLVTFLVKDADWRQTADVVDAVKTVTYA